MMGSKVDRSALESGAFFLGKMKYTVHYFTGSPDDRQPFVPGHYYVQTDETWEENVLAVRLTQTAPRRGVGAEN